MIYRWSLEYRKNPESAFSGNGSVRQDVASQIAVMPLHPFEVTLLWHAFSAMERVKPIRQCGEPRKPNSDNLLR